jgi:hypothetical protein
MDAGIKTSIAHKEGTRDTSNAMTEPQLPSPDAIATLLNHLRIDFEST